MQKELNPNLFNVPIEDPNAQLGSGLYFDPSVNFRGTERTVDRAEIKKMDDRFNQLNDHVQEAVKTMALKVDKVTLKSTQLDQRLESFVQDTRSKHAALAGKVTERSLIEGEVHSLLERHNLIVRSFETRLNQMQKVIENQQMQLMNSQAFIEEARRELAKFKKSER
jgi:hypothetical protein